MDDWQRLKRQFELADGFWLGFVLSNSPSAAANLRGRVTRMLEEGGRSMLEVHPGAPGEMLDVIALLLGDTAKAAGCVWVEALGSSEEWGKAWGELAAGLNERREALRRWLGGGLIIVVAPVMAPYIRDGASDLWSVRAVVINVSEDPREGRAPGEQSVLFSFSNLLKQFGEEHGPLQAVDAGSVAPRFFPPSQSTGEKKEAPAEQSRIGSMEHIILEAARRKAQLDGPVLITGARLSGKRQLARLVHENSRRFWGPLVIVEGPSLSLRELLGYQRGAFLGAIQPQKGVAELADHGTLVIHEVGGLAPPVQEALVHLLDKQEVTRLNAKRPRRLDVRVLATSSDDLEEMCREGSFRQDLYHRLSVSPLETYSPPTSS